MYTRLSQIRIFEGMEPSEIEDLMSGIHHQVRSYKNGEIIAYAGDPLHHLMIVLEGKVLGEISNIEGKSVVVSEIPAPGSFAEAYLFASKNRLKINVRAVNKVSILSIHKDYYQRLLSKDSRLLENYLNIISNRFVIVTEKLNFMMIKSVKGRLAYYFMNKQKVADGAQSFALDATHEELAVFLGITRPALTRKLNELKKEGIISIDKKIVTIKDIEKLKQLVN